MHTHSTVGRSWYSGLVPRKCVILVFLLLHVLTVCSRSGEAPVIVSPPVNLTTLVHQTPVALQCTVSGEPLPKITWQQWNPADGQWHHVRRHLTGRYRYTKSGQRLEIVKLYASDAGFYRCSARNDFGVVDSEPAYLDIHAAAEIVDISPRGNRTVVVWGTKLILRCVAVGLPPPYIHWIANGELVTDANVSLSSVYSQAVVHVNATESVLYECVAENRHIQGHTKVMAMTAIVVMDAPNDEPRVGAQIQSTSEDLMTIIIVVSSVVLAVLVMSLVTAVCCRICRLKMMVIGGTSCETEVGVITKPAIKTPNECDIDVERLPCNDGYYQISALIVDSKFQSLEYRRNDLCYVRDIGHGAFGQIFKARASNIAGSSSAIEVAVKVLDDDDDANMEREFLRSASVLSDLGEHVNILRLLGVCFSAKPFCVIMEYADAGDLHRFLRDSAPSHFIERRRGHDFNSSRLTVNQQIDICQQIAAGMAHIAQCRFVHRDLAARNCLVSTSRRLEVKIADFGLARRLPPDVDFYEGTDVEEIAVRWTAIEAIVEGRFTVATDVWSFGITVWEVFSYAARPYSDLESSVDVVRRVVAGRTLDRPDGTPSAVYDLMVSCWHADPTKRPHFTQLVTLFTNLKNKLKH